MNKFFSSSRTKNAIVNSFCLSTSDELAEFKAHLIKLTRLWFIANNDLRKINRDLTMKYGYFQGCKISKALNELLTFITFYKPFLSINSPSHPKLSDDEKCIIKLIFRSFVCEKEEFNIIQNLVPEKQSKTLVRLAEAVNLSLT